MLTKNIPVEPIQKAVNRNDTKESRSKKIIRKYTLLSGGAALIPYDFVDVITATAAQTLMIKDLCNLYNVPFSESWLNVAVWSAAGSAIIKAVSGVVESVLGAGGYGNKLDLSGAAIAAIYTATSGEFYKLHLRDGGTLENINIGDFVDYFIAELKRSDINLSTFTNPKALLNHLNVV